MRLQVIDTGEVTAVHAVVVAGSVLGNIGLATVTCVIVAVRVAGSALKDAVTTGGKVSSITVAVRESAVVNVLVREV